MHCRGTVLLFSILFSYSSLNAADKFLSHDLVNSQIAQAVTLDMIAQTLNRADLISLGETHEGGLEKKVLTQLAQTIFSQTSPRPNCIVETYEFLIQPSSELDSLYKSNCNQIKSSQGNGPGRTTFAKDLEGEFQQKLPVVTHSGLRHILPWGKLYPLDFTPANIDSTSNNTISTQLPKTFKKLKRSMVSVTVVPFDHLFIQMLSKVVKDQLGKPANKTGPVFKGMSEQIKSLANQEALTFGATEDVKYFELKTINKSFSYEIGYLALIDHKMLSIGHLVQLLESKELQAFVEGIASKTWTLITLNHVDMGIGNGGRTYPPGSILLYAQNKNQKSMSLSVSPQGQIVLEEVP